MDVLENRTPDLPETAPAIPPKSATLSVVLICADGDSQPALDQLAPRCKALNAELILVRPIANADEKRRLEAEWPEVQFQTAESGVAESLMREIGVAAARGDVIALRSTTDLGDGSWMAAFHRVLGFDQPEQRAIPGTPGDRRRRLSTSNEFPIARERRRNTTPRATERSTSGPEGSTRPGV